MRVPAVRSGHATTPLLRGKNHTETRPEQRTKSPGHEAQRNAAPRRATLPLRLIVHHARREANVGHEQASVGRMIFFFSFFSHPAVLCLLSRSMFALSVCPRAGHSHFANIMHHKGSSRDTACWLSGRAPSLLAVIGVYDSPSSRQDGRHEGQDQRQA